MHRSMTLFIPKQTLRPVTIHQILTAERAYKDAPFTIDGAEVHEVLVVATLLDVKGGGGTNAKTQFILNDGSGGRLVAECWPTEAALIPATEMREMENTSHSLEKIYVRVHGQKIDKYQDFANRLVVKGIKIAKNRHEIEYHILNAIAFTVAKERGLPPQATIPVAPQVPTKTVSDAPNAASPSIVGPTDQAQAGSIAPSERHVEEDSMDVDPPNAKESASSSGSLVAKSLSALSSLNSSLALDSTMLDVNMDGPPQKKANSASSGSATSSFVILDKPSPAGQISTSRQDSQDSMDICVETSASPHIPGGWSDIPSPNPHPAPEGTHSSSPRTLRLRTSTLRRPEAASDSASASGSRARRRRHRDPYANLTPLQRDIMIVMHEFKEESTSPSSLYYKHLEENSHRCYVGVNIGHIIQRLDHSNPDAIE
ncbi:hypothetical protein PLICRDRAFT_622997 [Plicaturopsis crispa FD-325 SS-3]|nr:hypothetical protein PLICRDRAFT_622997 [Plicaturopsis crispa FD-325 SS-3]